MTVPRRTPPSPTAGSAPVQPCTPSDRLARMAGVVVGSSRTSIPLFPLPPIKIGAACPASIR
jgi:hypothetical protein